MKINFTRGVLEIEDARIIYRNFEGRGDKYNREGERNFSIIIPTDEIKDQLLEAGWNVKIKEPREVGGDPFMTLPVKVKFNARGPAIYVLSGNNRPTRLNEETVAMLDEIDIQSVRMDIRPYEWDINGKKGITAYLQAMEVTQNIDRFGAQYAAQELPF